MKKYFSLKYILIFLIAVFGLMQSFRIDKDNPSFSQNDDFLTVTEAPENIRTLVKNACYDCHSNETQYPWYSNLAPVSWWLKNHISEGRKELNFNEWDNFTAKRKQRKLDEALEMIEEEEMPIPSYTWVHRDARLTTSQRATLTAWLRSLGARDQEKSAD